MAIHVNDNETYVVLSHFPNLAIHEAIKRRRRDNANRVSLRHLFTLFPSIMADFDMDFIEVIRHKILLVVMH